jgi:hypothetical protein
MACADDSSKIVLHVPCRARYARIARTAVAAYAVLLDFSVDGLADVRLLVDEVFMTMRNVGVDSVFVRLARAGDAIAIEVGADAMGTTGAVAPDLGFVTTVIAETADSAELDLTAGRPRFAATVSRR